MAALSSPSIREPRRSPSVSIACSFCSRRNRPKMLVQHSAGAPAATADTRINEVADEVSVSFLRGIVETMAIPRHYELQPENNRLTAHWIARQLRSYGYETELQGEYTNVVARSRNAPDTACVLVGAHYDSVPGTPG